MKKRLLSIILTLCMVMSITPLNAFAVTEYGIWIGEEQVTSDKTWSKQGWKYDIQSKTLTLLGYNMATIGKRINGNSERPSRFGLIYVEGEQDLNIKLVGSIDLGDSRFQAKLQPNTMRATAEFMLLTVISRSLARNVFSSNT